MKEKHIGHCVAIIPARYSSKRFPGKMLAPILGKSLLQRTYENAKRSPLLNSIVIATDDERIFDHAKSFGAEVVMTSIECLNGTDRLAEAYKKYYSHLPIDIIVNIQGDEPCLEPEALNAVIEALAGSREAHMSTAIVKITSETEATNPSVVKCVIDSSHHAIYFSRALIPSNQSGDYNASYTYYRHLGIYAYRPEFLMTYSSLNTTPLQIAEDLEQLKALEKGYKIKVAIVESHSTGVDIPEDIKKVERLLCKQNIFLSPVASAHL
ncbi:MAG: 3-deoxy-manno-octulosonate cytidylyltransferase [Parachlamydiaceae bacterium]|nr:3-deoxy-manno-octulosonate cytidylyltransferase [Parachlamydiaceae bacterium]